MTPPPPLSHAPQPPPPPLHRTSSPTTGCPGSPARSSPTPPPYSSRCCHRRLANLQTPKSCSGKFVHGATPSDNVAVLASAYSELSSISPPIATGQRNLSYKLLIGSKQLDEELCKARRDVGKDPKFRAQPFNKKMRIFFCCTSV